MISYRTHFITSLFSWLNRVDYLWLKATLERPEETPGNSDIDLFIKKKDLPDVLLFISKQENLESCEVKDKGKVVFLQLVFTDGSELKVDLLTQLVRKQWNYLTEAYLFENRIWSSGIATYTTTVLLEHVILFNFLNHSGLPKKYIVFFKTLPDAEQARLLGFINQKYGTDFTTIEQMAVFRQKIRKSLTWHLKNTSYNQFAARLHQGLGYLKQKYLNNWTRRCNIITFSGVDGAGKSTLLNDLKLELAEKYGKKIVVLRHRPSLLPILSAWTKGKQAAEAKAASTLPRKGNNYSLFSSLARFSYYYLDYLLGQVYVWARYTLPGYTVIYDRYYFDFIVDGRRTNIELDKRLPKWLYRFIAKPSLNVFLYADPAIILQRKKELPAADIAAMTMEYKTLFEEFGKNYRGKYLCIENIDRLASLQMIMRQYLKTIEA